MRWLGILVFVAVLALATWQADVWLGPLRDFLLQNKDAILPLGAVVAVLAALWGVWKKVWGLPSGLPAKANPGEAHRASDGAGEPRRAQAAVGNTVEAGPRGVAVGGSLERSVVVTGDGSRVEVPRDVPPGAPEATSGDLAEARAHYLDYLRGRYRFLDVKGMGTVQLPLRLPLLDLFVPLLAQPDLPRTAETWEREMSGGEVGRDAVIGGRRMSAQDLEALGRRAGEPRRVLELVQAQAGLVVLGDPGSGKTTFLKFLAVSLAAGKGEALGLGDRLPLLVPLAAYARQLAKETHTRLDEFVGAYLVSLGVSPALREVVRRALAVGEALLLLDGLDEVRDEGLRRRVAERVAHFFSYHNKAGNRFVLTSRLVGYADTRPVADGLVECTLVDFRQEEIEAFLDRWCLVLEHQIRDGAVRDGAAGPAAVGSVSVVAAEGEKRDLLAAVAASEGVRKLAANPLLLTILALMKRHGMALPERRVQLYHQYLETLISSWARPRTLDEHTEEPLDFLATQKHLAPLALWMHEVSSEGLGLVGKETICRRLEQSFAEQGEAEPEALARCFLEDVRERTGLLIEKGHDEYGFLHLTFEEFLAAVGIAQQCQADLPCLSKWLDAHLALPPWREVCLLLLGYLGLIQNLGGVAGKVLESLILHSQGEAGMAVVLAGEALCDMGPKVVPKVSRQLVVEALIDTMQSDRPHVAQRRDAGALLGRLGWAPADLDAFIEIPAGPYLYGVEKQKLDLESPFWIGKYPVTNQQYHRFTADRGYERQELWSEEGWVWLKKEKKEGHDHPRDFGGDATSPLFPRVGVTQHEAEAYCRWVARSAVRVRLGDRELTAAEAGLRGDLPTSAQWERAARGEAGREYPWEGAFAPTRANTREGWGDREASKSSTAVCTYPQGANPAGLWDLAGNIFEWPRERSSKSWVELPGGSFWSEKKLARCAARGRGFPGVFSSVGFRVVLSLASSEN